ncbi:MAG: NAD(P)-dependent oxidoreductase [Bradyrhizobium sp.]|nr:NAD(P)-dependent oxidoreductase [Bradyrhizobium sp.]
MPHETPLIATIVAGLGLAFVFGALAQRFRFPPLVGYLLAGVAVGPFTPGFVADQALATELAELGITVHLIKGYGDTAVAEAAIALMWAAARGIAQMDREMRAGNWLRDDGMQLTGKTLGLIGFGGIAAEVARIASGSGMKVIAWNRSPKSHPGVAFTDLDTLLKESHVVSLHLLLNDETRGFLSRQRIAQMRKGVIFVNTARAAIVDEAAMIDALRSGHIRHAGLDVFNTEPLPANHVLTTIPNVTLSAHSAFRTPEASENLIHAAWEHCRRVART